MEKVIQFYLSKKIIQIQMKHPGNDLAEFNSIFNLILTYVFSSFNGPIWTDKKKKTMLISYFLLHYHHHRLLFFIYLVSLTNLF